MSPKMRACLALLILFSVFSLLPTEKKMRNSMEITLSEKSIPLTVFYNDWQSSLEVLIFATNALKGLESSIGIPYPPDFGVGIMLGGDPAGYSYYMGNGRIELLMTRHWRGALAHELAHLWFNYQTLPPWIAEGASELYAYEVFVNLERYGEALDYRSRSTSSFMGREPPLDHFKWRGKEEENYAKAMMLFLHLRDIMGMEGLRRANVILFGEHVSTKVSSTQYEEILRRASPEHAREISSLFQEFVYIKNGEEPGLGYVSVFFFIATLYGEKIFNSRATLPL
jgi:hypothetical protein